MKYSLQNLLTVDGNTLSGPMSPLLFAQEICREMGFKLHGLIRVCFDDAEYHNIYEGKSPRTELTGMDTVIIISRYSNGDTYAMYTDSGCTAVPAFLWFTADEHITEASAYQKQGYAKTISKEQAKLIFDDAKIKFEEWYKQNQ